MSNFKIKQPTVGDAAFIALLGRITFGETFGHLFRDKKDLLVYYDRTFSISKIEKSLTKPNNIYWLAFVDQRPVGYAKLKLNSPSPFIDSKQVCQLQKIYVLRDFHSKKIGFEMQDKLLHKAAELDFEHIWLSVLESNERAISFYKKAGFVITGHHDFHIGKEHFDFIAMIKRL